MRKCCVDVTDLFKNGWTKVENFINKNSTKFEMSNLTCAIFGGQLLAKGKNMIGLVSFN
jgi:hypothetical protein